MKSLFTAIFALSLPASVAFAKLTVITTTTDLRALAAEIGGAHIEVDSIAKGTQDPHFIEAKPSFMVKASRADLIVSIGMDLEVGWLPSIVRGARNPKINSGQSGNFETGPLVTPLEVPNAAVSRADGDVHPAGNPHVTLDPLRAGEIALALAKRLGELDPTHAAEFTKNAEALRARLQEKTKQWMLRLEKSGVKKVITYHKTLSYFLDRFKLENSAILEPKPGIPPTSGHIIGIIQKIKTEKIPLILVENYFDPTVTQKIKQEAPTIRAVTVPVAVEGAPGVSQLDDLYETLVKAIEGK